MEEYSILKERMESAMEILKDFRENTSLCTVIKGYESMLKEIEKNHNNS